VQFGRNLQPEHREGLGERDRESACWSGGRVLPDPFQQDMASDCLIEFLAGPHLKRSIVRVEVDAVDIGAESVCESGPLEVVDDPCPKASVGIEVIAEATEGVTQSGAFVSPGVVSQRWFEHPGGSEEIDHLPCALETALRS